MFLYQGFHKEKEARLPSKSQFDPTKEHTQPLDAAHFKLSAARTEMKHFFFFVISFFFFWILQKITLLTIHYRAQLQYVTYNNLLRTNYYSIVYNKLDYSR